MFLDLYPSPESDPCFRRDDINFKKEEVSKQYFVYILSNSSCTTLYTGVTSDLKKRIWEHENKVVKGFTQKYNVRKLVHYEIFEDPDEAICREKCIKRWKRSWKDKLINENNPGWKNLASELDW